MVESSGSGFLKPPSVKPKVLFEGHAFHRLTGGRFDESHPRLSYPRRDRKQYSGSLAGEWERLEAACLLDRAGAMRSASWGLFRKIGRVPRRDSRCPFGCRWAGRVSL